MITYGELFAGYGGMSLGLGSVFGPGHVRWYAETADGPAAVMAHHYPLAPNLGDVTAVDWASVPRVDVLTGGTPCQDLSHAGKRLGMRPGTRSGLWAAMTDAIDTLRPPLVVWENVRGVTSADADSTVEHCPGCMGDRGRQPAMRALGRVLGDLADLRYDTWWVGLRAADVGCPHGRFRVFLFAEPATDPGRVRRKIPARGQLPTVQIVGGHGDSRPARDLILLPTPAVNDMGGNKTVEWWDDWTEQQAETHGNYNGHGKSLSVEIRRLLPTPEAKLSHSGPDYARATRPGSGGDDLTTAIWRTAQWGEYADAVKRWETTLGRPAPARTEPALRGPARLAPRFVEWLMGLPEGHVTDVPGVAGYPALSILGNGVVPQQIAAAATLWLHDLEGAA